MRTLGVEMLLQGSIFEFSSDDSELKKNRIDKTNFIYQLFKYGPALKYCLR